MTTILRRYLFLSRGRYSTICHRRNACFFLNKIEEFAEEFVVRRYCIQKTVWHPNPDTNREIFVCANEDTPKQSRKECKTTLLYIVELVPEAAEKHLRPDRARCERNAQTVPANHFLHSTYQDNR